ncbi:IS66 family insertion sequence element accessory protein TnpB [Marinicellulosiphila megalodicopiae]|uniref:IS66 family insertion sequence element accessory protein TnpB n=1 Tax=Marinicellulosiphila megalodicopiae TaxID=2724896 RepID=UPI003BAFDEAC
MKSHFDFEHIYLHRDPVDFRKAINGLSMIVTDELEQSCFQNALFIFCNKHRDRLKILYWDQTGFCLWHKRLEEDKFKWPKKHSQNCIEFTTEQLDWLLRGLDVSKLIPHSNKIYDDF